MLASPIIAFYRALDFYNACDYSVSYHLRFSDTRRNNGYFVRQGRMISEYVCDGCLGYVSIMEKTLTYSAIHVTPCILLPSYEKAQP